MRNWGGIEIVIYDSEVLGITTRASDRIKLGGDEGLGRLLSGIYFEGVRDGNLEGAGPVCGDPLYISEVTGLESR